MRSRIQAAVAVCMATVGVAAAASNAAITIDGTLDSDYGSALAVQTNVTNSQSGSAQQPTYHQLSNAYGMIDTAANKLHLFFGGSFASDDQQLVLAIQTTSGGVANLHNTTALNVNDNGSAAGLENIGFDTGFTPTSLFTFKFDGGRESDYYNLVNNTHATYGYGANPEIHDTGLQTKTATGAPTYSIATNDALASQQVGAAGNTAFADANTGIELEIDLSTLGYTAGNSINVSSFLTSGSFTGMTNQVLAPYVPNPAKAGDYPYLDQNRQFENPDFYPGNQYFTVAVPEPASLSLLGLMGVAALRRRGR